VQLRDREDPKTNRTGWLQHDGFRVIAPRFFPKCPLIVGRAKLSLLLKVAAIVFFVPCAFLFNGCSSTPAYDRNDGMALAPLPPNFLTGPASALLTNIGGFSAHLVMSNHSPVAVDSTISGELLGREGQLLFAAEPRKAERKRGAFLFVSDVRNRQGLVISEALQGYAPATGNVGPTNLMIHPGMATRIGGHACEAEEAIVDMSDGSRASFLVFRAIDLNRFPISIISRSNTAPFTLWFSKIRIEPPPAELFAPPKGFTKYENPEMMLTELIIRQHKLKRRATESTEPEYDYKNRR
jgi:hypothetical protein